MFKYSRLTFSSLLAPVTLIALIGASGVLSAVTIIGNDVKTKSGQCTATSDCFPTRYVAFNQNAAIGDRSEFDEGTQVMPQAGVGAVALVGKDVFIGTKTVVNDGITIGEDAFNDIEFPHFGISFDPWSDDSTNDVSPNRATERGP